MTTVTSRSPALNLLTISQVEDYLQGSGWTKAESANPNAILYRGPNDIYGEPLVLALPAHSDLLDAKERLLSVVHSLATLEAKTPIQMAQTIIARHRAGMKIVKAS